MSGAWDYCYPNTKVEPEVIEIEKFLKSVLGSRILDFGCGGGRHTIYFARKGSHVFAFDQSDKAVEQLGEQIKREKLDVDLRIFDMIDLLPYKDNFFDAVLAVRVIQHGRYQQIRRIVAEIDRVLKDEGILFLQVTSYEDSFGGKPQPADWVESGTLVANSGPEKGVLHHFFTKSELQDLLQNYEILDMHSNSDHYDGYCVLARKLMKHDR
jgi:cyclopropane fatty-acyl-phospholipid synthase-like methyltransferase